MATFELPPLPYDYSALEPVIDTRTMQLHHDKHHQAYLTSLVAALDKHPKLKPRNVEELLRDLPRIPEGIRTAVRNHGGGHSNHSLFWKIMKPKGGGPPTGAIRDAIRNTFSSFETFQQRFVEAGAAHFGSGWVWLVRSQDGKLDIVTTPNQDSPLMQGLYPVFGNDLWEHAYYLTYNNRRADYLKAWWQLTNWEEINRRFEEAQQVLKQTAAA